ncbi:MAG: hypothetical protein Q7J47_00690 [Azoarcus sp.]|nr:hypothetical protein [Azoarcus sp.]
MPCYSRHRAKQPQTQGSLANLLNIFSGEAKGYRCFMNSSSVTEWVLEQQGELFNTVHAEQYRHHQEEATS